MRDGAVLTFAKTKIHGKQTAIRSQRESSVIMPTISEFFGIVIRMYYRDHAPAHFHAYYGEYEAIVRIQPPEISAGHLPQHQRSLVLQWARQHQDELLEDWSLAEDRAPLKPIKPLG